ncbi:Sodium-coupled monocarboxylate transporter 1 [Portunus trituberculatus]|uniref:Sodium-coupled monocarboxylate transporter 1 n=1 Tax=Portunus trituberculatus TaxID=210409 RepID=A0A5B7I6X4_PORTR|nr:Sodium-coupled monocarboxylate transporter 1 [Portunus trituberculatus]
MMGVAIFAVYANCDPIATEAIQKADQIVPFYVMDRLSSLYGVAGLFMASLYAAGLRLKLQDVMTTMIVCESTGEFML